MAIQIYDPSRANFPKDDFRALLRKAYRPNIVPASLLSTGTLDAFTIDPRACQEALLLSVGTLKLTHNLSVLAQNIYRVTVDRLYYSDAWVDAILRSAQARIEAALERDETPPAMPDVVDQVIVTQATAVATDMLTHVYMRGDQRRFARASRGGGLGIARLMEAFAALCAHEALFVATPEGACIFDRPAAGRMMRQLPYIFATEVILTKPRYLTDVIIPTADTVAA